MTESPGAAVCLPHLLVRGVCGGVLPGMQSRVRRQWEPGGPRLAPVLLAWGWILGSSSRPCDAVRFLNEKQNLRVCFFLLPRLTLL